MPIKQPIMTLSLLLLLPIKVMMLLRPGTWAAVLVIRVEMPSRVVRWSANSERVA